LVWFLGSPGRNNQTTSRTLNLLSTNFWITDGGSPGWWVVLEVVPSIPRAGGLVNFWMTLCRPNFFSIWNQIYRKDLPLKIFPDKNLTSHKHDPLFFKKFDHAKKWPTLKKFSTKKLKLSRTDLFSLRQIDPVENSLQTLEILKIVNQKNWFTSCA